jgi:hypothetical protein
MPRTTELDKQWQTLMDLCAQEKELARENRHPKVLRFVSTQIDKLAREMGFAEHRIRTRDFRAARDGARITKILTD